MFFVIHAIDKPGHGEVRAGARPAHLEYMKNAADRLLVAGPTLAEDGAAMTGSLIIIEATDRAEAEAFTRNDPYTQAGLFDSVTIAPWKLVFARDSDTSGA
jgi:uncharacterized protein YciI